jgi:hypothetical protein
MEAGEQGQGMRFGMLARRKVPDESSRGMISVLSLSLSHLLLLLVLRFPQSMGMETKLLTTSLADKGRSPIVVGRLG